MTTTDKSKIISNILRITKKTGDTNVFDRLHDKNEQYLSKLLQVCKNLKKQK